MEIFVLFVKQLLIVSKNDICSVYLLVSYKIIKMKTEKKNPLSSNNVSRSWWAIRGSRARGHEACRASFPRSSTETQSEQRRAGPGGPSSRGLTQINHKVGNQKKKCGARRVRDKHRGQSARGLRTLSLDTLFAP